VRQLAAYYDKSPDQITEEELRPSFLYLRSEQRLGSSDLRVALGGIKFLFEHTLRRPLAHHAIADHHRALANADGRP
jgi:hypothetical protein